MADRWTDETRDGLAQAMADNNPPEVWTSPQLVPVGHFARVALAWLAERGLLREPAPDDDPVSDPQTFTMPEPPDGTRLEFDWHTDRYAAWRDDTSSTEAGWPTGNGGRTWVIYPGTVPHTWAWMCAQFGAVLAAATRLVPAPPGWESVAALQAAYIELVETVDREDGECARLEAERDEARAQLDKARNTIAAMKATIDAFPDAHHAANLAHARTERDKAWRIIRAIDQAALDQPEALPTTTLAEQLVEAEHRYDQLADHVRQLRTERDQLRARQRTIDIYGQAFVYRNAGTGEEQMLAPQDVMVVVGTDYLSVDEKLRNAEAERDAMRRVVEAAKAVDDAWRNQSGTGVRVVEPLRALSAVIDTYTQDADHAST